MPAPGESRWSPAVPALAAAGATILALALVISHALYDPLALALVSAAGVSALAAAWLARRKEPRSGLGATAVILAVGVGASIVIDSRSLPGVAVGPALLRHCRPLLRVSAALLLSYAWPGIPRWAARVRFPALVALATALGAVVLLASPEPAIDVWDVQQQGAVALLSGRNPYEMLYPNIYGPGTPFLDPRVLTPDGRFLTAYPYTPLTLLVDAPAAHFGDVRWTMLAAAAVCAWLIGVLGRGAPAAELAGVLLLLQPEGRMVLALSWTEPFVLATLLLLALAVRRTAERPDRAPDRSWLRAGLAAAVALSAKQYVPLLALPFLFVLPARDRGRAALLAVVGAGVLIVPFLVANPTAFVHGLLEFQLRQPFRTDALSWPAAIVHAGGPQLPPWPAFALAGAVLAATLRRDMSVARALLASASTWIVFVVFNKQAFANYYWLGVGLLAAAVAALAGGSAGRSAGDGNAGRNEA